MRICCNCGGIFHSFDWKCDFCHSIPEYIGSFPVFAPELAGQSEGFKVDFFENLALSESNNFWFISRNKLIIWALKKYFPGFENMLEIGCGTGFVLSAVEKEFPIPSFVGSDIFAEGLKHAAKRIKRAELLQMDCRKIPYVEEFDVIGAFDVIEHVEEDREALKQIHRAVRPGGGIIITVPQHKFLWSKIDEYSCHFRRYSSTELRSKVEGAGFKIIRITSFVSLLFPFMLASRLKTRSSEYNPEDEFKINNVINRLFTKVLSLEQRFVQMGVNMPVGGSLLLIAKKLP